MLFNFFKAQWKYPAMNDWTAQVKIDLEDFGIKIDLDYITSRSTNTFKQLVKIKAKQFAFSNFMIKKEKHSKVKELFFTELKTQAYLTSMSLSAKQAQAVFSYRTRMASYSENFQNNNGHTLFVLCA